MKNEERLYFMLKRFAKSALAAKIASFVIGRYIHLVYATSRWEIVNREYFDAATAGGRGVIIAFWHGRLLMAPTIRRETEKRFFMLVSTHRDGDIITNSVRPFDIEFIRGSAANPNKKNREKGGMSASVQIIGALRDGHIVGITPDGPRGPGEKVNIGLIRIAQMSNTPILPITISVSRGRRLKTWDNFLLAWPFSRGVFVAGAPIDPPRENDDEALESTRQSVENALIAVTHDADMMTGLGVHGQPTKESA